MNFFRFTLDIGEDFVDGKLPTLDVKIQHEYEYMEEDDHGEGQLVWRQERERTDWYQPWSRQEDETIPEGWKRCERSEDLYCDVCPLELRGDTDQYVKGEGGHHGQDDKVLSQVPGGRRSEAEEHVNHWLGSRARPRSLHTSCLPIKFTNPCISLSHMSWTSYLLLLIFPTYRSYLTLFLPNLILLLLQCTKTRTYNDSFSPYSFLPSHKLTKYKIWTIE